MALKQQVVRYLVVGALGTLAHLGMLAVCVEWLGLDAVVGAALGFLAALALSYVLSARWTFEAGRMHIGSLWRYAIVCVGGLLLNTAMMYALVHALSWRYFSAQLSVIFVVPISNFLLNRYWTFARK